MSDAIICLSSDSDEESEDTDLRGQPPAEDTDFRQFLPHKWQPPTDNNKCCEADSSSSLVEPPPISTENKNAKSREKSLQLKHTFDVAEGLPAVNQTEEFKETKKALDSPTTPAVLQNRRMLELKGGANNPPAPAMHVESTSTHKEESNDGKEKEESAYQQQRRAFRLLEKLKFKNPGPALSIGGLGLADDDKFLRPRERSKSKDRSGSNFRTADYCSSTTNNNGRRRNSATADGEDMDEGLLEDDDNNNDEEELEEDEGEVEELLMGGERAQTEYALCQSSSDYYEYRRKQKARSLRREKLEKRHCDKSSSAAGSVTGRREKSMPKHDDKGCLKSQILSDGSAVDLCDCLQPECEGCMEQCPKCGSQKCSLVCRLLRFGRIEWVQTLGDENVVYNPYYKPSSASVSGSVSK